ncbi:IS66 family insertion sequence element accessory protein TnpA [Anaerocolumna jejuensis]
MTILADFDENGQSTTAYCKDYSINVAAFRYWKRNLPIWDTNIHILTTQ